MFPIVLFLTAFPHSFAVPEWSYEGPIGPEEWPFVYPNDCSLNNQSPINIEYCYTTPDHCSIEFICYDQTLANYILENTGRTVEILPNPEALEACRPTIRVTCLDSTFFFGNFHCHWGSESYEGSEHSIDGEYFPMECHLVHVNEAYGTMEEALKHKDGVVVLAVFFDLVLSRFSYSGISAIADSLYKIRYAETEVEFGLSVPLESLLPPEDMRHFYRYNGSLTTPNCTEAVIWIVFETPKKITEYELNKFRQVYRTKEGEDEEYLVDNFRPQQPINDREIFRNFHLQWWWWWWFC